MNNIFVRFLESVTVFFFCLLLKIETNLLFESNMRGILKKLEKFLVYENFKLIYSIDGSQYNNKNVCCCLSIIFFFLSRKNSTIPSNLNRLIVSRLYILKWKRLDNYWFYFIRYSWHPLLYDIKKYNYRLTFWARCISV